MGRSPKAGRRDASPRIQRIHSPSPRGRGQFGKDAEIRTHQALHEAKPSECPKGDRDSKLEAYFKNRFFLQAVYISIITENLTQFKRFVYIAQIGILKVGNNSLCFFDKKLSNHLIMNEKFCIIER